MPTVETFLKAVMKELHTLFLYPGPDSSFHLIIWVIRMSMKVLLHFWKQVDGTGAKSGPYGECGKMVGSSFSIVCKEVCEV
jgi:hypothetical protein